MSDIQDVIIIGGGITGLAAAYYLQSAASDEGRSLRYTLLESAGRLGGKIVTEHVDGFTIEGGPDCVIGQKPWAAELARKLGLGDELMGTNEDRRKTYVLNHGRLTPLPDGVMLIVPTRITPFVTSPLISWPGKIRMGMDLFLPRRPGDDDESVADFVRRRLGREALDKIAEPLMGGIHVSDPEMQSLLGTFPRFRDLEKKHRSLILGMLAAKRRPKVGKPAGEAPRPAGNGRGNASGGPVASRAVAARAPATVHAGASNGGSSQANGKHAGTARATPAPTTPFITLRGGLGQLVAALTDALTGQVLTGAQVSEIRRVAPAGAASGAPLADSGDAAPEGAQVAATRNGQPSYYVRTTDGRTFYSRALVLATPSYVSGELVADLAPTLAGLLSQIRYVSTATVSLGYRAADLRRPLNGFGLVIPRGEGRQISACTWSSTKFDLRAPEDSVLVRCFVGGPGKEELVELSDAELLDLARREVKDIMDLDAQPVVSRIYRWRRANPQYDVGHLGRVRAIHAQAAAQAGLFVAGSAFDGVGVPDCVRQGKEAAANALTFLTG